MNTIHDMSALPTTGVTLTVMQRSGVFTYTYECRSATVLAEIVNGTLAGLDSASGESIISIHVNV